MYGTREYSLLVVHQHSRASCYGEREGGVLHEQRGIGNERMASSPRYRYDSIRTGTAILGVPGYHYWVRIIVSLHLAFFIVLAPSNTHS